MPFIYDPVSWSPNTPRTTTPTTTYTSETSSPAKTKMPSLNIFRRKSSNRTNTGIDRTAAAFSGMSFQSPLQPGKTTTSPTRRPANLPSVANPFSHNNRDTPSEPPPSYSPAPAAVAPSTDNPFAFLSTFDTVFLIDDSGSMAGSKWRETADALKAITPICTKHDKDGIDLFFLNTPDSPTFKNVTSEDKVQHIFDKVRPGGGTPTGARLNSILKPYLRECEAKGANKIEEVKPMNIIVITDGEAHDDPESVILNAAKKLDRLEAPMWQLGIQFFQVGNDPEATKALNDLDDGLQDLGCERDIVDTVPWRGAESGIVGLNAEGILKVVLGAVNRRLDRKRNSVDWRPTR